MLEEALQDPAKHPAEVAQAMLSFVRDLPSGGASSEERFINLVLLLCTRRLFLLALVGTSFFFLHCQLADGFWVGHIDDRLHLQHKRARQHLIVRHT